MNKVITIDIDIGLIDVHVFCTVLSSGKFWLVRFRMMPVGLWTLDDGSSNRLFSKALPIADGDHALHHVLWL